jgi:hypothetical protein
MYAKFQNQNSLIVNSADENEQFILADFIRMANSGEYELVINKLLDINGDTTGICIELVEKPEPPVSSN